MLLIETSNEERGLFKFQSHLKKPVRSFTTRKQDMTEKRPAVSFMIEDILGDTRNKRKPQLNIHSTAVSTQCSSTSLKEDLVPCNSPVQNFESLPYGLSHECSHLPSHIFVPPSPSSFPTRFGYHSPSITASPPYAFPSCNSSAFFPPDFNEHLNTTYLSLRHENIMRSAMYNPSVILDLSNYVPKSSSARIPTQAAVPISSSSVECSGGHQIIWKHFPRNPAKRKGGQIRFTTEQTTTLEGTFQEHKYLSSSERKRLAAALRLSERQVKTWFQNRRAKWRRIKQEPTDHASSNESDDSDHTDESCRVEHHHFPINNKTHPSPFV